MNCGLDNKMQFQATDKRLSSAPLSEILTFVSLIKLSNLTPNLLCSVFNIYLQNELREKFGS